MPEPLYWGDLHCHTGLSYGKGSVETALANGKSHVDFVAVIGHAFWPDMKISSSDLNNTNLMHFGGFEKLARLWPAAKQIIEQNNQPGEFVTFLGYEWHSNEYGDYVVLFKEPDKEAELITADTIAGLKAAVRDRDVFVIPHHIGYMNGERGLDWDAFTEELTPIVEICSEHGEFESDDGGPHAVESIPMGPRVSKSTAREGMTRGYQFGFVGSTDNHQSFPAAYLGGRVGVYAESLTRGHLWESIAQRRTIACKGDCIAVWVEANGAPLGSQIRLHPEGWTFDVILWLRMRLTRLS